MKTLAFVGALVASVAAAAPRAAPEAAPAAPARDAVAVPGFGEVEVVLPAPGEVTRAVVLLSDARGPDASSRALARALSAAGALVAVVDTRRYLAARAAAPCAYPAGDLEALAQRVQKVRGLPAYVRPVLVGHAQGAAVAWAALAQAPAGTFAGVVAVAPCPDAPLPVRLCPGSGPPTRRLAGGELPALAPPPGPMEIVAARGDPSCRAGAAAALARATSARYAELPGAGRALDAALVDAAVAAAARAAAVAAGAAPPPPPPPVVDLPLVEVPSTTPGTRLAVLLTGDGGWVDADEGLARALAEAGVSVVGLDSLRYFWRRRTPQEAAADVARIFAHYRASWGRADVILVGYSRGADVVPIVVGHLPPAERPHVKLVALLGPSTYAELEVHALDLLSSKRRAGALSTEDAVRASGGTIPVLCVHGSDEGDSLCPHLADLPWVKDAPREGGHRLHRRDAAALARQVLEAVP